MAEATLQGIWTQKGLDKETAFRAGGERKKLTHVAVGDGNGSIPLVSAAQTGLVNEVWRGLANAVMVNPDDPTDLLVDVVIPNNVGGFWIREWGIFDEDGDLVAVGPHDEMHKPLISTGQAAEFLERFHLPSANATFVEIKITSQALATQQYVESKISEHDADAEAHETLARKSVQIKAGTGLMGGGTLEADRTLTVSYGTAAGTACQGNDARLSNARTPTAHKSAHKTGGTDALIPADIGAVPTTVQVIAGTGLSGGGSLAANRTLAVSFGTTAGTVCQGNDSRLNNARTPVAHKATHAAGGADALTPEDIGAASNTVKIRAGVGLSGGGPLSNDVTLSAKLTDSVSSTDSTTAASATAVKTAYEAAQSKLPLAGGTVTGSIQINDPANVIGSAPSTDLERGLFLGDKNSVIMGGFDIIQHASDNAKRTQMFAKNASGAIASIAAVMYEDGTREISTDCPMRISDVQIERIFDNGVRLIKISGARGNEGYSLRFSPDNGQLYLDGREMHGKADTAGYADTAGSANALGGKAESALSVAFASEAQNAYGLKGMDMIIAQTTYTLPGYGTWKYSFTVFDSSRFYDQVVGESPGGTTFSPVQMGWPEGSFMDGLAFRSA